MIILVLIQNIALLVALAAVFRVIASRFKKTSLPYQLFLGLLFGGAGILGMTFPLKFIPGIIFDGRSIILSIAGIFGGPIAALVAVLLCGGYRLWLGGGGAAIGVSVILESAALGVAFYYFRRRLKQPASPFVVWGFGLLVHVIMLGLFTALPNGAGIAAIQQIGLAILLVYPIALLIIYYLFQDYETQLNDHTALQESKDKLQLATESGNVGTWDWDVAKDSITWDDLSWKMLGYPPNSFPINYAMWRKFVHPDDLEAAEKIVNSSFAEGDLFIIEFRYRTAANDWLWVQGRGKAVARDTKNQPVRVSGTHINIMKQKQSEGIMQARLRLMEFAADHSLPEILQATLQEAEKLTNSQVSFYHFFDEKSGTVSLQTWSKNTLETYCLIDPMRFQQHYPLAQSGIWTDCIRQRKPIIHNEYITEPNKKGMPEGHAIIHRELVVPVKRGEQIVAVLGIGNKPTGYDDNDIEIVSRFADLAWDIAERKDAENSLRESEERFRLALTTNPDAILITRLEDGICVEINDGFTTLTGYAREDLINRSIYDFGVWKSLEERDNLLHLLETEGYCQNFEATLTNKNGSEVVGLISARVINLKGKPHIISITRDISDRKRTEAALIKSEIEFKKAQAVANVGSWEWHIPTQTLKWSDQMYKIFGIDKENFSGSLPEVINQAIHPDDRARVEASNLSVIQYQKPIPVEYRICRPDGDTRVVWAEAGELTLDDSGKPLTLTGVVQDITERKWVEEQMHLQATALESAANAIVITDSQGVIEWANPAYEKLTGYSAIEIIGKTPRLLKSGMHDEEFYQNLWDTILSGQVWHSEIINKRKNGELYTEEETITPLNDQNGKITHFIGIKQDITARKQHEIEIESVALVSAALRSATNRSEMLPVILDQIMNQLNVEGSGIELMDPATGDLVIALGRGIWERATGERIPAGEGISHQIITTKRPYINNAISHERLTIRPDLFTECCAVAGMPLIVQNQIIGALWVGSKRTLTDADIRLLTAIADIAANAIHRATLHEQTQDQLHQLMALREIDQAIIGGLDLDAVLEKLVEQAVIQLRADAVAVLLYNSQTLQLEYGSSLGFRTPLIKQTRLRLGEGQAGRCLLEQSTLSVVDGRNTNGNKYRISMIIEEGFVSHHTTPLIARSQPKGVLEVFHRTPLTPDREWLDIFESFANQAAIAIDNIQLFEGLQRSNLQLVWAYDATIEGWSRAMDLRDQETEGHTQRVTELTMKLALEAGVSNDQLVHIYRGALLHDIGKLGVPDHILNKPGPLTEEEWVIMKKHPALAFEMLSSIEYLRPALEIPFYHHEKWDGTGYPRGLQGQEIPFSARLFALADVYDALTSDRPYRKAWPPEKALEYIREQAGKHFDPKLVDIFMNVQSAVKNEQE